MKKYLLILFLTFFISGCSSQVEIENFEGNKTILEETIDSFYKLEEQRIILLENLNSKTEINFMRNRLKKLNTSITEGKLATESLNLTIKELKKNNPSTKTNEYLDLYLEGLNNMNKAIPLIEKSFLNAALFLNYMEKNVEYNQLSDEIEENIFDAGKTLDELNYTETLIYIKEIQIKETELINILEIQISMTHFENDKYLLEGEKLYQDFINNLTIELEKSSPSYSKIISLSNDYQDNVDNLEYPMTSTEVEEEWDTWLYSNVYYDSEGGQEFINDAHNNFQEADEYLDEELNEEIKIGLNSYKLAPSNN